MKKIIVSFFLVLPLICTNLLGNSAEKDKPHNLALSAGYVFKHDSNFKDVYGHGIINAITADWCYYRWKRWGLGAKLSYWRKKGKTSFLKLRSVIQEVPATLYVRRIKKFNCGLEGYASLGGGLIWLKEKSYMGDVKYHKGIGEAEVGLQYPVWRFINVLGAVRCLFPPRTRACEKVTVGGFDLRAGIGFSF